MKFVSAQQQLSR